MDIDTYNEREKNLDQAQRLLSADRARLEGVRGYSIRQTDEILTKAIERGQKYGSQDDDKSLLY